MATVVFVHGTGVRSPHSEALAGKVAKALDNRGSSTIVMPCLWGDTVGARLHADGASIPTYNSARSHDGGIEPEDELIALWAELYANPFYELALLGLRSDGQAPQFELGRETLGEQLDRRTRALRSIGALGAALGSLDVTNLFEQARDDVAESGTFGTVVGVATEPIDQFADATARAIVARLITLVDERDVPSALATDADARDQLVELIAAELADTTRAIDVGSWLTAPLRGAATRLGTWYAQRKRGVLTDSSLPGVADILLYQGRGNEIRSYVRSALDQATPPVVAVGHSLGGIACVDVLAADDAPTSVVQLVTVGSQAPLFYELNALHSLNYGEALPEGFPPWLNIYDLRDILSYTGRGVFGDAVTDKRVDTRQPFPRSHSAYWDRKETWDLIAARLP